MSVENHIGIPEIINSFPEHVRKVIVNILKTGEIQKDLIGYQDIIFYLEVGLMSLPLKSACEEIILERMNQFNCVGSLEIADKYELSNIQLSAIKLIVKHFSEISKMGQLLNVRADHLIDLCSCDKVANDNNIFETLKNWLDHDPDNRKLSYDQAVESVKRLRSSIMSIQCPSAGEGYKTYHVIFMLSNQHKHTVMAVVCNDSGRMVLSQDVYHNNEMKDSIGVCCIQRDETEAPYVYMTFGKQVIRFDPILSKNQSCHPLLHARDKASLVSLDSSIYVIGGTDCHGNTVLDVEELDTSHYRNKLHIKKSWSVVATLPSYVKLSNAPCICHDETIYIVADFINMIKDDELTTGILTFKPSNKTFDKLCIFPQKLSNCKAILLSNFIFVASNDGAFLKINIESGLVCLCSDIPTKLSNFSMHLNENILYLTKGCVYKNKSLELEIIEYDIIENKWTELPYFVSESLICGSCDIKIPCDVGIVPFDQK